MLLRFRVANHRSIRDEQELSLVAVPGRGEPKPKASELPPTVRVAGIYGANASGKSNVLNALNWMVEAVRYSHSTWRPDGGVPRQPFVLGVEFSTRPSLYEVDFVHDGTRYAYGFEVDDQTVRDEWLTSFPTGRPVRLFTRSNTNEYYFGRSLTGEKEQIKRLTRPNSLFLSCAASNNHDLLGDIHRTLGRGIQFARQDDFDQHHRTMVTQWMLDDPDEAKYVTKLIQLADVGVGEVTATKVKLTDEETRQHILIIKEILGKSVSARDLERTRTEIEFHHDVGSGASYPLKLDQESAGTQAWFALIGHLMMALSRGNTMVVDEIDSSLHPMLTSTLIRAFKDSGVNRLDAQLVFASHDTTLLGTMLDDGLLSRDEVWFTEKDRVGATSLFSLAEFKPRREENVERGYLQGRYGAVPYLDYGKIRETLTTMWDEDLESV